MKKTLNEKVIKDFIQDETVFTGFIELFNYCKQSVPEIVCDIRDNLIGVKVDGERLRFYFNKLVNGKWYIKIKEEKQELFNIEKLTIYKQSIDKTNEIFKKNPLKNKLKTPSTNAFHSEHIITNNGKIYIRIHNLEVNDIDKILKEIEFLKDEGIKKINITISQKE